LLLRFDDELPQNLFCEHAIGAQSDSFVHHLQQCAFSVPAYDASFLLAIRMPAEYFRAWVSALRSPKIERQQLAAQQ